VLSPSPSPSPSSTNSTFLSRTFPSLTFPSYVPAAAARTFGVRRPAGAVPYPGAGAPRGAARTRVKGAAQW
jgi:hypothetical protein